MVGIVPNDAAIVRLVGSQLLEQEEEWQLERRRFFSEATKAKSRSQKSCWNSPIVIDPIQRRLPPLEAQQLLT